MNRVAVGSWSNLFQFMPIDSCQPLASIAPALRVWLSPAAPPLARPSHTTACFVTCVNTVTPGNGVYDECHVADPALQRPPRQPGGIPRGQRREAVNRPVRPPDQETVHEPAAPARVTVATVIGTAGFAPERRSYSRDIAATAVPAPRNLFRAPAKLTGAAIPGSRPKAATTASPKPAGSAEPAAGAECPASAVYAPAARGALGTPTRAVPATTSPASPTCGETCAKRLATEAAPAACWLHSDALVNPFSLSRRWHSVHRRPLDPCRCISGHPGP